MSQASIRTRVGEQDRDERSRRRIAALVTLLLHLLLVLLVVWSPPITLTSPQGGSADDGLDVTFIDESLRPPPARKPPTHAVPPRKRVELAPKASRVRTTLVTQPDRPAQTEAADTAEAPREPADQPVTPPSEPISAPPTPEDTPQPRRPWGLPPGMQMQDLPTASAGPARGASSGLSMEAEGYQVYYDVVSETRLRAWHDQGMTELSMPLPGTRRLMVCPLEIIRRRGSGPCRMVEPDAPELKAIGDARDVIDMQQVYKLGELVWSGPGAYR